VSEDGLKLTTYFGERDRVGGRFSADALLDLYERHELAASVLLRGTEGFGMKHHLRTERLLTLSEDLPLVSVAVDARARIERAVPEVLGLMRKGLVTLERARLVTAPNDPDGLGGTRGPEAATKLTVYCGRKERVGTRPAGLAVVELLRAHGVAGATCLLGVDGTTHGVRRRARFFGRNADVPLMVIAIAPREAIAKVLPELSGVLERPLLTFERVRICRRDGERIAPPPFEPEVDASGLGVWQKLTLHASADAAAGRGSLHGELIRRLREEGASGVTAVRGIWGYHGDHEPHGDRLLSLRRRSPVVTTLIDRPARIRRWFGVVDELTAERGLVTVERVPAFRAGGPEGSRGGLELAAAPGVSAPASSG